MREPSTCSIERRLRQLVEDLAERIAVAVDDAGRIVGAVAFELAAGRDVGVVADVQRGKRLRGQQQPVIEMLDVDRIVGRRRRHLGDGRPPFLLELLLGPAAGHDDPRAGFLRLRRLADFFQRLLQRGNADPVHLGAEGQRGADAVDMSVGEAGNHGAAAEVDQPGLAAGQLLHRRRGAGGQHPAVVDRQRLLRRKILVDGEDFAVEQDGVGGLGRGRATRQQYGADDQRGGKSQNDVHPSIFLNSAFATFSSVERGISSTKRISRGTLKSASAVRQAAITLSCRSGGARVDAGVRDDEHHRHFVQHRMLLRHHRGLAHARHHRDDLLDLGGRDVLAADLQHVLGAVAEFHKAVVQQRDAVAGEEKAVLVKAFAGGLFVVQVFLEQRQSRNALDRQVAGAADLASACRRHR